MPNESDFINGSYYESTSMNSQYTLNLSTTYSNIVDLESLGDSLALVHVVFDTPSDEFISIYSKWFKDGKLQWSFALQGTTHIEHSLAYSFENQNLLGLSFSSELQTYTILLIRPHDGSIR